MNKRLVVVGSGIVGLAHAKAGLRCGYDVTVVEKTDRPLGASVRNFGTIWPIGQPQGKLHEMAVRTRWRWKELSDAAGFWFGGTGSLHLAYMEEGWDVLRQYAAAAPSEDLLSLCTAERIAADYPHVNTNGLLGGLFSEQEAAVQPAEALSKIIDWLAEKGVQFRFSTAVTDVSANEIKTSSGHWIPFDRLVVCSGDEVQLLFPDELRQTGAKRCKLQMMRTVAQPADWQVAPTIVADLTLRHYESFAACEAIASLRQRVSSEMPDYDRWGIHVIAAQKPDGTLILGDSHEYDNHFDPGSRSDIDAAVLDYLRTFLVVPDLSIDSRWSGTYLKSPGTDVVTVVDIAPNVQVVTGLGGAGMTLSFAFAEDNVNNW